MPVLTSHCSTECQTEMVELREQNQQLRTQLASAEARVEGMKSVIKRFLGSIIIPEGLRCPFCLDKPALSGKTFHKEECPVFMAQALLTPAAGGWVTVRVADIKTILKYLMEFALFLANHGLNQPIPELIEARERIETALGTGRERRSHDPTQKRQT